MKKWQERSRAERQRIVYIPLLIVYYFYMFLVPGVERVRAGDMRAGWEMVLVPFGIVLAIVALQKGVKFLVLRVLDLILKTPTKKADDDA